MAEALFWSPTQFRTPQFDASHAHFRRSPGANLGVSAGRTWTTCLVTVPDVLSNAWRPFRFNMGSLSTERNFVIIEPDTNWISDRSSQTPSVMPTITTASID